jgi:hypothetical protein
MLDIRNLRAVETVALGGRIVEKAGRPDPEPHGD